MQVNWDFSFCKNHSSVTNFEKKNEVWECAKCNVEEDFDCLPKSYS